MNKIAIMMSVYNGEKYLEKQLNSIYEQTVLRYSEIFLFVRDDGSSDNTIKILKKWSNKLNIIIDEGTNIGAKNSFYELLYHVGEYDFYAFCDQDDIWEIDKLEQAIKKISGADPRLYFSNVLYIDEYDNSLNNTLLSTEFKLSLERIFMCNPANGCTMVWNKSMHRILITRKYTCFTMHDEYCLTIAYLSGTVIYDEHLMMKYRLHINNVTQSKNLKKKIKLWKWVWFDNRYASLDKRCKELLDNVSFINVNDKKEIEQLSNYKKGFNRFKLLRLGYRCENKKIERSFRMRMLLGIL